MPDVPAYLRIAGDIRARIASGEFPPGAKLPTESRIMADYDVSSTVAKWAMEMLKGEGLIEGRRGSGTYVRTVTRLVRDCPGRDQRTPSGVTAPFARDSSRAGHRGSWEHHSKHEAADLETARRLALEPGAPVMATRYVFRADDEPVQISHSREPLAITGGTPIEWPENGPVVGVVARMDSIGVRIDSVVERVTSRAARPNEMEALAIGNRSTQLLIIERTYYADDAPVETADIAVPGHRYELVYRLPIE
ncbi:MAG TPA: GntR family transcriptional regulator [Micromonosporaceae bacterium]|nr:GntR family transcriptional regulator [Micromonosporaceae bacterium]